MQIPVVIETVGPNQYRAHVLVAAAEGKTSDEALDNLRDELEKQLNRGKQFATISIGEENPWLKMADTLRDDPIIDEWRSAVEEFRRQRDIEDGIEYVERP